MSAVSTALAAVESVSLPPAKMVPDGNAPRGDVTMGFSRLELSGSGSGFELVKSEPGWSEVLTGRVDDHGGRLLPSGRSERMDGCEQP
jgi:hypothetical protein